MLFRGCLKSIIFKWFPGTSRKNLFFIFLISLFFFTGCSYFFNRGEQEFRISYKSQSDSCISRSNKTIKDYFNRARLPFVSKDQIDQFRICYENSIESFVKYTGSGRLESESYSVENIALFLRKFYPEIKVSSGDIKYYLTLKYFLIGGSPDALSKKELLIIKNSLSAFSELLKAGLSHRSVYLKKITLKKGERDYKNFDLAFEVLNEKVNDFIDVFENFNGDRNIDLRYSIQFFINKIIDDKPFAYLDMMISFKNLVIPSQGDFLKRENLKIFINQSLIAYRELMRFEYFVRENHLFNNIGDVIAYLSKILRQLNHSEIFQTTALRGIGDIVMSAYKVLSYPIGLSPDGRLSYGKISDLLVSSEKAGVLGEHLTAEILNLFIKRFSKKWLAPGSEETIDLTMSKISYVKDMYFIWLQRQQIINTLFSDPDRKNVSLTDRRQKLKGYKPFENWIRILKNVSTHQWREDNQMILSKKMNGFSYKELTVSNSIIFLSQIFMKPYNLSVKSVRDYKLEKEEVQEIYEILRILGIPLGFMDSRVVDSGYRVFDESNNFSTQINNNDSMNFFEVYEYLSFALSSFRVGQQFYENISDDCLLDYMDVHDSPVIKNSCFRSYLKENFNGVFGHLKTIGGFWKTASDIQKNKFMGTVEYVAREGLFSDVPYKSGEIRTTSVSLYYLESIFFNFDYNKDGFISGNELINARYHFQRPIGQFLSEKLSEMATHSKKTIGFLAYFCDVEDEDIMKIAECLTPRIFLFLLNSGELPISSIYNKFVFLKQLAFNSEQDLLDRIQANTHDVFRFFSMMSREGHKALIDQIKVFLLKNKDILFSELSENQGSDCKKQENETLKFCQWAEIIRCDETIKPYLYEWMRDNRYGLFSEKLWNEFPDKGAVEAIKLFSSTFRLHQRFSVHCYFPEYQEDTSYFLDFHWLTEWIEGNPENRGLKDDFSDLWESIKNSF